MAHTHHLTHEFEDGDEYAEVEITFGFTPGSPDTYDKSRGGPGGWDPGWPAEVEFLTARRHDSRPMTSDLTDRVEEWLASDYGYEAALQAIAEQDEHAADEHADEQRRERALEQDR